MRDVVDPVDVPAVSRIYHRNGSRVATINGSFAPGSPRTSLSLAARMERELFPRFAGIPGLRLENGGQARRTREIGADLQLAAIVALVGIGLVITLILGSPLEAIFVVAIVPFSTAGVILAFWAHGMVL